MLDMHSGCRARRQRGMEPEPRPPVAAARVLVTEKQAQTKGRRGGRFGRYSEGRQTGVQWMSCQGESGAVTVSAPGALTETAMQGGGAAGRGDGASVF